MFCIKILRKKHFLRKRVHVDVYLFYKNNFMISVSFMKLDIMLFVWNCPYILKDPLCLEGKFWKYCFYLYLCVIINVIFEINFVCKPFDICHSLFIPLSYLIIFTCLECYNYKLLCTWHRYIYRHTHTPFFFAVTQQKLDFRLF